MAVQFRRLQRMRAKAAGAVTGEAAARPATGTVPGGRFLEKPVLGGEPASQRTVPRNRPRDPQVELACSRGRAQGRFPPAAFGGLPGTVPGKREGDGSRRRFSKAGLQMQPGFQELSQRNRPFVFRLSPDPLHLRPARDHPVGRQIVEPDHIRPPVRVQGLHRALPERRVADPRPCLEK